MSASMAYAIKNYQKSDRFYVERLHGVILEAAVWSFSKLLDFSEILWSQIFHNSTQKTRKLFEKKLKNAVKKHPHEFAVDYMNLADSSLNIQKRYYPKAENYFDARYWTSLNRQNLHISGLLIKQMEKVHANYYWSNKWEKLFGVWKRFRNYHFLVVNILEKGSEYYGYHDNNEAYKVLIENNKKIIGYEAEYDTVGLWSEFYAMLEDAVGRNFAKKVFDRKWKSVHGIDGLRYKNYKNFHLGFMANSGHIISHYHEYPVYKFVKAAVESPIV